MKENINVSMHWVTDANGTLASLLVQNANYATGEFDAMDTSGFKMWTKHNS